MSTLTIRNLDEEVKRKLRIRAASNGRSMEAEARLLLANAVLPSPRAEEDEKYAQNLNALRGRWKGKFTTDAIMALTRGED